MSRLRLPGRPPIVLTEIEDRRGRWLDWVVTAIAETWSTDDA